MGTVGCYTLDIYCDHPMSGGIGERGPMTHNCTAFPGQFTGRTEAECKRDALKEGWRLGRGEGTYKRTALCPRHARGSGTPTTKGTNDAV